MPKLIDRHEYHRLAALLAQVREEVGITQTELSARMGMGQKFVSVIETGARRIDLLELLEFERALGMPPFALLKRIGQALGRAPIRSAPSSRTTRSGHRAQ
ncbi:MAG: helix-turn-helix transcriptional regulator [Sphingomonadales bacterium]|nr:helix-turn-helix transcriptional regulator [Sphingomonadales bacterium]